MIKHAIVVANRFVFEGGASASLGLLTRTLTALAQIGVTDVCVVDGEHAAEIRNRLRIPELAAVRIQVLANKSWRRESGSAVLLAREFFATAKGPCLVVRGDRPLDAEALAELASSSLGDSDALITVAAAPPGDLGHEVKVRIGKANEVTRLGLDLERFDAVFTGHMLASPALMDALAGFNNPSIEDALTEIFLQPIHDPFKELVSATMFQRLIDAAQVEVEVEIDVEGGAEVSAEAIAEAVEMAEAVVAAVAGEEEDRLAALLDEVE
ncbi:MAG TPA: NTP transferase domain-containing protein, partial [Kofleriaceae bacterium]|nr:NTP transferase domain-containing protein [Kofleriaceae bacterium]